ncbi:uncharacterized protein mwh [Anabrus simplex]|uniref:uncharacterized protein mwh n=1 Tax=Anabrus simplex TaxID=316456 RepID=UPI0035A38110
MAPNSEEEAPRLGKAPDTIWSSEDPAKEQQRPPVYNPEDYAMSLRKWGRRGSGGTQSQLYGSSGTGSIAGDIEAKSKTLPIQHQPHPSPGGSGSRSARSVKESKDYRNPILTPTPLGGEMSLRQFASVSELLSKLRADLRLSFPSFVQEFIGDPLDGVTLLLELLRAVQLSQAAQQQRCPPPVLRRALLDEHACLQCLRSCMRCPDAARRLSASPAGLFTLAVCIMSNVSKSRVVALELLTKACEPPGCGHGPVSEALSTLRLRFGEPVRFRFLVGMLSSSGVCPELQAAGLKFLNTFLDTAPSPQSRLYLQAELEQAGFQASSLKKVLPHNTICAELVRQELIRWEQNYLDVEALKTRAEDAEKESDSMKEKMALLERRVQILQEEKGILLSLEQCLKERCCELQKEVSVLRKRQSSGTINSLKQGGSTPAEDEGISSSDHDQSLSPDEGDVGDDIEREPMVYELFDVQNDTILVERSAHKNTKEAHLMKETSVDQLDEDGEIVKSMNIEEDEEEETTIDEVIEELRNIINDAETEAYAAEAAEEAAKKKQKELEERKEEDRKIKKIEINIERAKQYSKHYQQSGEKSKLKRKEEPKVLNTDSVETELDIVPSKLLPQPPRRARSLMHLMFQGRGYEEDGIGSGNPFFDDETPSHTSEEDSDSLLSAAREHSTIIGDGNSCVHKSKRSADIKSSQNRSMSTLFVSQNNSDYGKAKKYQSAKNTVNSSSSSNNRSHASNKEIKKTKSSNNAVIKRSESFHHTHSKDHQTSNTRYRRDSQSSNKDSHTSRSRKHLPRYGSFDGLFFVTDITSSPVTSTKQKHRSPSADNILDQRKTPDPPMNSALAAKRLKSKSLDRIDEGLNSLVDIVMTHDRGRSRVSSGRGSTEDWSLEWDKNYFASRSRRSVTDVTVSPINSPPPVVIVSRSTSTRQQRTSTTHQPSSITSFRDYHSSTHFPRRPEEEEAPHKRHPPDGSSHPLFLPVNQHRNSFESIPHQKHHHSPTNSHGGKPFVLKRGHTNAGLYSGHHVIRDTPAHMLMHPQILTPSPDYSRTISPVSHRPGLVVSAKVTDLPSGLY